MNHQPGFDIIPFRIRIGVTGHRTLPDTTLLASAIKEILTTRYREAFTPAAQSALEKATATPIAFTILSPLAEGADRLAARVAMEHGGLLEALLPLEPEEYKKDFATEASQREFDDLLARAHRMAMIDQSVILGARDYRQQAYRRAGEETVEQCDILIAIWDGKEPQNECGTGAIAALAQERKKPVFILSTVLLGSVELKNGGALGADFIDELNTFNAFRMSKEELNAYADNEYACLFPSKAPIPGALKQIVRRHLIPGYCRASRIAKHNQGRYHKTSRLAYLFSTLSVAFMAGAIVFAKIPFLSLPGYMIELALLITLYFMIHRADDSHVHSRWLEHRVLSEQLRMAFYFAACGETPIHTVHEKTIHRQNRSWIERAYREILYRLPKMTRPASPSLKTYSEFIRQEWLGGQLSYHKDKAKKAMEQNKLFKKWGMRCFGMAIAVSIIHHLFAISAAAGSHVEGTALLEELLSIIAVALPAAGAAVNGYRSIMEQSRIASRSKDMTYHLERMLERPAPEDIAGFRTYLERIEDLMLMESHDWMALLEHAEIKHII